MSRLQELEAADHITSIGKSRERWNGCMSSSAQMAFLLLQSWIPAKEWPTHSGQIFPPQLCNQDNPPQACPGVEVVLDFVKLATTLTITVTKHHGDTPYPYPTSDHFICKSNWHVREPYATPSLTSLIGIRDLATEEIKTWRRFINTTTIGLRTLDRWAFKGFLTGYLIFPLGKGIKFIFPSIDFSVVFLKQQSLFPMKSYSALQLCEINWSIAALATKKLSRSSFLGSWAIHLKSHSPTAGIFLLFFF